MTLDRVSTQPIERVRRRAARVRGLERGSIITEARAELHQAIRDAHAAGHSMRAIAEAAGISHQRVAQLLQKEEK